MNISSMFGRAPRTAYRSRVIAGQAHRAALAALLMGAAFAPTDTHAQAVAITNARIHTAAGPVIERGTIVIRDGRIAEIGAAVTAPAGARVIDAAGKVVTPGLLDSQTTLAVVEIGLSAGPTDPSTTSPRLTAAYRTLDAINPEATAIAVTRVAGITRVVVAPSPGTSILAGRGTLVDLGGDRVTDMVHVSPTAMYATLGEAGANLAGGSREAALLLLREALQDALDFDANRGAWQEARRRSYALGRLDLEALAPVVRGELPLAINAHRASDLLAVLRLRDDFPRLRLILTGATEGWRVADQLVAADIPVIIDPMSNIPGMDSPGITLENAARLHAAGVRVAFATFESHNVRNLRQRTGTAIAYGMPADAALRAVTAVPAAIWGIEESYGTLETGRAADVVVWSGDPFELTTAPEHVFIEGREITLDSRAAQLFERYRVIRP